MTAQKPEQLKERRAKTGSERDPWRGKSDHHYTMARSMVEALRKQIAAAESTPCSQTERIRLAIQPCLSNRCAYINGQGRP